MERPARIPETLPGPGRMERLTLPTQLVEMTMNGFTPWTVCPQEAIPCWSGFPAMEDKPGSTATAQERAEYQTYRSAHPMLEAS